MTTSHFNVVKHERNVQNVHMDCNYANGLHELFKIALQNFIVAITRESKRTSSRCSKS